MVVLRFHIVLRTDTEKEECLATLGDEDETASRIKGWKVLS
jgi:hypothetical protein